MNVDGVFAKRTHRFRSYRSGVATRFLLTPAQQVLPAEVEPEREFQRVLGADGDAGLAQAALGRQHALAVLDILGDANIHRAHLHARITFVALLTIAADLQQ